MNDGSDGETDTNFTRFAKFPDVMKKLGQKRELCFDTSNHKIHRKIRVLCEQKPFGLTTGKTPKSANLNNIQFIACEQQGKFFKNGVVSHNNIQANPYTALNIEERTKYFWNVLDMVDLETSKSASLAIIAEYACSTFDDRMPPDYVISTILEFLAKNLTSEIIEEEPQISQIIRCLIKLYSTVIARKSGNDARRKTLRNSVVNVFATKTTCDTPLIYLLLQSISTANNYNARLMTDFIDSLLNLLWEDKNGSLKRSSSKIQNSSSKIIKNSVVPVAYYMFHDSNGLVLHVSHFTETYKVISETLIGRPELMALFVGLLALFIESKRVAEFLLSPSQRDNVPTEIFEVMLESFDTILPVALQSELTGKSDFAGAMFSIYSLEHIIRLGQLSIPLCIPAIYENFMFRLKTPIENLSSQNSRSSSQTRRTPFHTGAINGRKNTILFAIKKAKAELRSTINILDSHGHSALYYAIENEKWEVMKILLDHGADPNAFGDQTKPPIMIAIEKEKYDEIEQIVRYGGVQSLLLLDDSGHCPLELLAEKQNFDRIFKSAVYGQVNKLEVNEKELKRKCRVSRDITIQLSVNEAKLVVSAVNSLFLYSFSRNFMTSIIMNQSEIDQQDVKLTNDELLAELEQIAETDRYEERRFAAGLIADNHSISKIFPQSEQESLLISYWKQFSKELATGDDYFEFVDKQFESLAEFVTLYRHKP